MNSIVEMLETLTKEGYEVSIQREGQQYHVAVKRPGFVVAYGNSDNIKDAFDDAYTSTPSKKA